MDNIAYIPDPNDEENKEYDAIEAMEAPENDEEAADQIEIENENQSDFPEIEKTEEEKKEMRRNSHAWKGLFEFDDMYIRKHWDGRLKLLEMLATFAAAICLPMQVDYYLVRFIFFRFVCWTTFGFVVIDLILHLFSIWPRLPRFMISPIMLTFLTGLAFLSLISGSCLVVVVPHATRDKSMTLTSAVAGFASMMLFFVETVLHCMRYRTSLPYESSPAY